MDKTIIYRALENPELISDIDVSELEKLTAEYPFFVAAQVLLTKIYNTQNDHRFADQLHVTAAHMGDRNVLYELVNSKPAMPQTVSKAEVQTEPEPILVAVTTSDVTLLLNEPTIAHQKAEDADRLTALAEKIMEGESAHSAKEHLLDETQPVQEVVATPPVQESTHAMTDISKMDTLELQILSGAVSRVIEKEVSELDVDEPEVKAQSEPTAIHAPLHEELTYAQWIMQRAEQLHYSHSVPDTAALPASLGEFQGNEISEIPIEQSETGSISHGKEKLTGENPALKQSALIDRFIHLSPKITPGKVAEYQSVNQAQGSLEEDPELVSETIAQIYASQGKLEKARKAYRKLMELHPEKSIYFAAQLKNLDKNKKA